MPTVTIETSAPLGAEQVRGIVADWSAAIASTVGVIPGHVHIRVVPAQLMSWGSVLCEPGAEPEGGHSAQVRILTIRGQMDAAKRQELVTALCACMPFAAKAKTQFYFPECELGQLAIDGNILG